MQVFDASSMIYAWDNYPERQFPGLWEWMAVQIEGKTLVMPSVAFEEVANKTPDCGVWLKDKDLEYFKLVTRFYKMLCALKGFLVLSAITIIPKVLEKMIC